MPAMCGCEESGLATTPARQPVNHHSHAGSRGQNEEQPALREHSWRTRNPRSRSLSASLPPTRTREARGRTVLRNSEHSLEGQSLKTGSTEEYSGWCSGSETWLHVKWPRELLNILMHLRPVSQSLWGGEPRHQCFCFALFCFLTQTGKR